MKRAARVACGVLAALPLVGAPVHADRPGHADRRGRAAQAAPVDRRGPVAPPRARPPGAVVRVEHHPFEDAPALGRPDAMVTIELYFIPGSPDSHNAYRVLVELQRLHPTRVRAVFRPMERSAQLVVPAITLTAHARGRFFALMAELTRGDSAPSAQSTLEIAVRLGIDRALVSRAHVDEAITGALHANRHRYFRLEATSIPAMVLNGRLTTILYDRTVTLAELEGEYRAALDAARLAIGQGVHRRALAVAGARQGACGELETDELVAAPPATGGVAEAAPIVEAPAFNWHLGALTSRGTGCPPTPHVGGRLDDHDPAAPPDLDSAYLLTAPLPIAGMPALGPPDAPVSIQVVCNLRGSACAEQLERARRVADHFGGVVRVVYLPWIDLALDDTARDLGLAEAALCAAGAGDGWAFVRAATGGGVPLNKPPDLPALAQAAGLDADAVVDCARGDAPRTRATIAAARAAGIGWGPTVVIGGRAYLGGFSDDRPAAAVIEAELAPGLLEALVPAY